MLITRPKGQNKNLIASAQALGYRPIVLPTLEIEVLPNLEPSLKRALEPKFDWNKIQLIILITQNVVWALPEAWVAQLQSLSAPIITMGKATTQAAIARGLAIYYTPPSGTTSEQLLEKVRANFSSPILILTGEGGRDFLAPQLIACGAKLCILPLYKRLCPVYTDDELEIIFQPWLSDSKTHKTILATSNQSLENFVYIISGFLKFDLQVRLQFKQMRVIVPSERVKQYAHSQGFDCVEIAVSARDEDMLAATTRGEDWRLL